MDVYEIKSMAERLDGNTYPGRGIVLGVTPDGKKAVAAYFIMGRSVNSRNRVFVREPDGIRTEAHDPALMKDPHLIIYHPVREAGYGLIVTNGDQTDTIWEYLAKGESWEAALRTRQFEDDGPNWTPRISGIQANDGSYKMSILKAADPVGNACARFFWEYPATAGLGHFLHTYVCDGNPVIPTFQGEPERVSIPADIDAFTQELWQNLDENNKISLFVRYTDLATRETQQDTAGMLAEVQIKNSSKLKYIYRLIALVDESEGLSDEEFLEDVISDTSNLTVITKRKWEFCELIF